MLVHEAIYDIDELLHENLHMHTALFSSCAKPEAIFSDMIRTAEQNDLNRIAFTDHVQERDVEKVRAILDTYKPLRDSISSSVRVYIGAELSAFDTDKFTLQATDVSTEFNLYACNHYHVSDWCHPEDRTAQGYKEHNKKTMEFVIRSGKCDCIAHPFVDSYIRDERIRNEEHPLTACWTDNELGDLLTLAKQFCVAFELSPKVVIADPKFGRRLFHIGKEIGTVFTMGTDAHNLTGVDTARFKEDYKRILI